LFLKDARTSCYVLLETSVYSFRKYVGVISCAEGEGKTGKSIADKHPLRLNTVGDPEISVKGLVGTEDEPVTGRAFSFVKNRFFSDYVWAGWKRLCEFHRS